MDKVVGWGLTEVNESLGCNVEAIDVAYILVESEFSIHLSSNSIRSTKLETVLHERLDIKFTVFENQLKFLNF